MHQSSSLTVNQTYLYIEKKGFSRRLSSYSLCLSWFGGWRSQKITCASYSTLSACTFITQRLAVWVAARGVVEWFWQPHGWEDVRGWTIAREHRKCPSYVLDTPCGTDSYGCLHPWSTVLEHFLTSHHKSLFVFDYFKDSELKVHCSTSQ